MLPNFSSTSTRKYLQSQDSSSDADDEWGESNQAADRGRLLAPRTRDSEVSSFQKSTVAGKSMLSDETFHMLSGLSVSPVAGQGANTRAAVSVFHEPEPIPQLSRHKPPESLASCATGMQENKSSKVTSYSGSQAVASAKKKSTGSSLFKTLMHPLSHSKPRTPSQPSGFMPRAGLPPIDRRALYRQVHGAAPQNAGLMDQTSYEDERRARRLQAQDAKHGPALAKR